LVLKGEKKSPGKGTKKKKKKKKDSREVLFYNGTRSAGFCSSGLEAGQAGGRKSVILGTQEGVARNEEI